MSVISAAAVAATAAASAGRRARFLQYAAVQLVGLTVLAMYFYPGGAVTNPYAHGYTFFGNFLSDLGATRSWDGHSNTTSMVLFAIALGTIGLAFIGFAGAWPAFAFAQGRARIAGIASQWFGTASGAAFVAVAITPVNRQTDMHNNFVIAAFALLLAYSVSITIVWVRNGARRAQLVASVGYLLAVIAYGVVVMYAVRVGVFTLRGVRILIVSQKIFAYTSMVYVVCFTELVRRTLRARTSA